MCVCVCVLTGGSSTPGVGGEVLSTEGGCSQGGVSLQVDWVARYGGRETGQRRARGRHGAQRGVQRVQTWQHRGNWTLLMCVSVQSWPYVFAMTNVVFCKACWFSI